jgi:hypothetical protein
MQHNQMELHQLEISHLKNTLSDRVAVNHCVVQQLEEDYGIKILELNCNLHPLYGIASKWRTVLKECDV